MEKITTVAELFDGLGGNEAVAKLLGTSLKRVRNMRSADELPERHHYRLAMASSAKSLAVDGSLFGLEQAS